eukprot:scaffold201544_cov18-Prasinocladus_malaysianus.AAC.1
MSIPIMICSAIVTSSIYFNPSERSLQVKTSQKWRVLVLVSSANVIFEAHSDDKLTTPAGLCPPAA